MIHVTLVGCTLVRTCALSTDRASATNKSMNIAMRPAARTSLRIHFLADLMSLRTVFAATFLFCIISLGFCYSYENAEVYGLVRISNKSIIAFNNRNLTIECHVDLANRSDEKPSFTTSGRMVLTFMTIPRTMKPLHQQQSFLHCFDPGRTKCRAQFNLDLACLEDQMNQSYYSNLASYLVEAACQVDDSTVCSQNWMARHPLDCYDLGRVTVINAPKLNQACLYREFENRTLDCGEHQYCNTDYGVCVCQKGYTPVNKRCIARDISDEEPDTAETVFSNSTSTYESTEPPIKTADQKGTFKVIVIFLLVVAVLLCISLGIVIIWSRHYRHLLHEVSN